MTKQLTDLQVIQNQLFMIGIILAIIMGLLFLLIVFAAINRLDPRDRKQRQGDKDG